MINIKNIQEPLPSFISDIQFGENHRFGQSELLDPDRRFDTLIQRLDDDLAEFSKHPLNLKPDLLVITGDLMEKGQRTEKDEVLDFLQSLLKILNLKTNRLLIVPGNHDINRK